jgi:transposase-like protein
MLYESVYEAFPTQHECLQHLEKVLWEGKPECPYCHSAHHTSIPNDRYKCNDCNRSYRVTVKTIFHNTKFELQKWFIAMITYSGKKKVSIRGLAGRIRGNKNSADHLLHLLRKAHAQDPEWLKKITDSFMQAVDRVEFEKRSAN